MFIVIVIGRRHLLLLLLTMLLLLGSHGRGDGAVDHLLVPFLARLAASAEPKSEYEAYDQGPCPSPGTNTRLSTFA